MTGKPMKRILLVLAFLLLSPLATFHAADASRPAAKHKCHSALH